MHCARNALRVLRRKEVTKLLRWFKVEGKSPTALDNVMKSLRNQKLMVRRYNGQLFACVNTAHQTWLTKVCSDFNAVARAMEGSPEGAHSPKREIYTAPCGEEFYDPILYSHHYRKCQTCKKAKVPKLPSPEVVARIEPGQEFNLDGVIASIEATRDRLYEQVETVDNLLKNLAGYRNAKNQLASLETEVKGRVDAVKLLIRDNKLT